MRSTTKCARANSLAERSSKRNRVARRSNLDGLKKDRLNFGDLKVDEKRRENWTHPYVVFARAKFPHDQSLTSGRRRRKVQRVQSARNARTIGKIRNRILFGPRSIFAARLVARVCAAQLQRDAKDFVRSALRRRENARCVSSYVKAIVATPSCSRVRASRLSLSLPLYFFHRFIVRLPFSFLARERARVRVRALVRSVSSSSLRFNARVVSLVQSFIATASIPGVPPADACISTACNSKRGCSMFVKEETLRKFPRAKRFEI